MQLTAKKLNTLPKSRSLELTHGDIMPTPLQKFEEALRNRPEGISPHTIRNHVTGVRKFMEWYRKTYDERMKIRHVAPVEVRDYKAHLQTEAKFKPGTINYRLVGLRVFFNWAVQEKLVKENPVRVKNLQEPVTAPRSLEDREYNRLLREVQRRGSKRNIAIMQLMRHAGLRVSELCNLEMGDIKISQRKGKVVVRSGKGRRYREVDLNLDVRRALKEYFEVRPEVNDPHVFIGQRRNGLRRRAVEAIVAKYAHHAKLDDVTPHVLRHTFGRSMVDKGVDLPTVQILMGHHDINSTARYIRPSKRDLEAAVRRSEIEEE